MLEWSGSHGVRWGDAAVQLQVFSEGPSEGQQQPLQVHMRQSVMKSTPQHHPLNSGPLELQHHLPLMLILMLIPHLIHPPPSTLALLSESNEALLYLWPVRTCSTSSSGPAAALWIMLPTHLHFAKYELHSGNIKVGGWMESVVRGQRRATGPVLGLFWAGPCTKQLLWCHKRRAPKRTTAVEEVRQRFDPGQ